MRRVQTRQRDHDQPVSSADDILKSDDIMFRGLTPPPWPLDLTPHKKRPRTVEEVITDNSPRGRDKLIQELEQMAESSSGKRIKLVSRSKGPPEDGKPDSMTTVRDESAPE